MKKKSILLAVLSVAVLTGYLFMNQAKTKTKSYYAGDAIYFNDRLFVATASTGKVEIFELQNNRLVLVAQEAAPVDAQVRSSSYNDVILRNEGGALYVYASAGATIYKFDFNDYKSLRLLTSSRDTTWDWLGHLDQTASYVVTAGSKTVKLWNNDLQVVDAYKVSNATNPYNVRFDERGNYIFNWQNNQIDVFNRHSRMSVASLATAVNLNTGNRQISSQNDLLYLIDDSAIKKMSVTGDVLKTLRHDSKFGYDVVSSTDGHYIYVSNGTSVAKLNTGDFKFAAGFENRDLKADGAWAMGLKVVPTPQGDRLVVFNNSNILVLNDKLKALGLALATEEDSNATVLENMYLKVDKNRAPVGAQVMIWGGGFGAGESLAIKLNGMTVNTQADTEGRFTQVITVPEGAADKSRQDIIVTGAKTGRHYNVGFTVEGGK